MSLPADIGWVEPATPIRGLDHLGVQAPCIAIYGQLLPGITNVTDRARYYSFYPWLIRAFEQRYQNHSADEFCRVLRRAECLFALIAIRHSRVAADGDDGRHGVGMVGRSSLLKIPQDSSKIDLGTYADLEGPNRYFQNKLGGLGQYYFGPLRDLAVLDYASPAERSLFGYDKDRGAGLANAFAAGVPESKFFALLEATSFGWADLDEVGALCPCNLQQHELERHKLTDLFFARTELYNGIESANRRDSLTLILDLANQTTQLPGYTFEQVFRASTYTGALPDGKPWLVNERLGRVFRGWAVYQQNEILSVGLQTLFTAVLREAERHRLGRLRRTAEAADVCIDLLADLPGFGQRPIADVVLELRSRLPAMDQWNEPAHELQRWRRILSTAEKTADLPLLVNEGVRILLTLLARGTDDDPYLDFDFEPDYFDPGELHLRSFRQKWQTIWSGMTIEQWVRWLAVRWGVEHHLRVALRKLRGERRDTFRIRPLERDLRVIEVPTPVATLPRLGKAFQILRDLGLVNIDRRGWLTITERGQAELEACLAA